MTNCILCKNKADEKFKVKSPYLSRQEIYQICHCAQCDLHFAIGNIDEHFLEKVYGSNFHSSSQQDGQNETSPIIVNAANRAQWLAKKGFQGRLLDIGAGKGYFVKAAQNYFQSEGIEFSQSAVNEGKNLGANLYYGDFLKHHFDESTQFDVVTLWDVMASLKDPVLATRKIASLLKPGGAVILTVPNAASFCKRILGRFWPFWIPPVNLTYYSRTSLALLFSQEGLDLKECFFQEKMVSLQFLILKMLRSFRLFFLEPYIKFIPKNIKFNMNFGNILTVIATKK